MRCVGGGGGGGGNDYLRTYILAYIAGLYTLSLYNYTRCVSIVHVHACVCTHHMHTHPYAYTPICIHIIPYAYTSLPNLQSHQQLYVVPCVLQHVGNYCYSMTLYLGDCLPHVCACVTSSKWQHRGKVASEGAHLNGHQQGGGMFSAARPTFQQERDPQ